MHLFSNRTSKCGKNISDTLGCASCATFLFLPHFEVICDLLLNRCTATWNLFVNWNTRIPVYFVAQGLITEWLTHLKIPCATYIDLGGAGSSWCNVRQRKNIICKVDIYINIQNFHSFHQIATIHVGSSNCSEQCMHL